MPSCARQCSQPFLLLQRSANGACRACPRNIKYSDPSAPLRFHDCRAAGQELHKADPAEDDLLYKCGDPEELAELEGDEDEE